MDSARISTAIKECRASGLPLRQLELHCKIINHASFAICILDAWISVVGKTGVTIAEGKLFKMYHANLAIIEPGKSGDGAIVIQLPQNVLCFIEEQRLGGDVNFTIYSRVLICEVNASRKPIILGQPRETQLTEDGRLDYQIPQSEWIKHLRMLAWSEIELIELPTRNAQTKTNIKRALDRFKDATDCYRRGQWIETLMNCRKSFEALIKDTSGSDDMGQGLKAIETLVTEGLKAEKINELIKNIGDFLHLARHEQFPDLIISPTDAQLALKMTGALLAYLN